jgi:hypothetical protein
MPLRAAIAEKPSASRKTTGPRPTDVVGGAERAIMHRVQARLLRHAAGYAVYGSDGGRLGTVIGLETAGEDRPEFLAIRRERIFLWRRRMVPISAVAGVDPKARSVSLLLDGVGVERAHERRAEEMREGWVADRIAHYADGPSAASAASDGDATEKWPAQSETRAPDAFSGKGGFALLAEVPNDVEIRQEHLLFVPSADGYALIEQSTGLPLRAETLELDEPAGSFVVVKLAHSPLPDDPRPCAYLDRLV